MLSIEDIKKEMENRHYALKDQEGSFMAFEKENGNETLEAIFTITKDRITLERYEHIYAGCSNVENMDDLARLMEEE